MPRLLAVLAGLALVAAGWAWLSAQDVEPVPEEQATRSDRTTPDPADVGPELAGRPRAEVVAGEWRGPGAPAAQVSGRVVDATDAPVAGVAIRLVSSDAPGPIALPATLHLRTAADGTFRFTGLSAVAVRLVLEHAGMARVEREVAVPTTDLVLRLAGGRALDGQVRGADGSGIPGAAVHLRLAVAGGFLRLQTLADRTGRFEFTGLPYVGLVSLAVDAGAHGRARPTNLPWKLGRPVILELDLPERPVDIRVTVLEERAEAAVPRPDEPLRWRRAPVFWDDEEPAHDVVTGGEGRVRLALPAGASVTFEAPMLPPGLVPKRDPAWTQRIDEATTNLELRVVANRSPRRVRITGRVVDEADAPILGATVGMADVNANRPEDVAAAAWPSQPRGLRPTDGEGRFAFETDLTSRPAGVFARAPGRRVAVWVVPPPPADVHDLTLTLKPGSVLVGRVVDQVGAPVPGARIELRARAWIQGRTVDDPLPVLSWPDGEYRLDGLEPRTYRVTVTSPEGTLVHPS